MCNFLREKADDENFSVFLISKELTAHKDACIQTVQWKLSTEQTYSDNQSVNQSKVYTLCSPAKTQYTARRAHWQSQPIKKRLTIAERDQSELSFHQRHHKPRTLADLWQMLGEQKEKELLAPFDPNMWACYNTISPLEETLSLIMSTALGNFTFTFTFVYCYLLQNLVLMVLLIWVLFCHV